MNDTKNQMPVIKVEPLYLLRDSWMLRTAVFYVMLIVCGEVKAVLENNDADFNAEIQSVAERTIKETVGAFQAAGGWALVQEVKTGRILAMVSYTNGLDKAVNTVYEPGSAIKPIILASALNERLVTVGATPDAGEGVGKYGGKQLRYHVTKAMTDRPITDRLNDDIFTMSGFMLGDKRLEDYLRGFGFAAKLECGLSGEASGYFSTPKYGGSSKKLSRLSIGCSVGVTALQMVNAYSCIANNGLLMRPYFKRDDKPEVIGHPVTREVARDMREMLYIPENEQYLALPKILAGLSVAGKAGTSQKVHEGFYSDKEFYASFVGFVPANNPAICIIVTIDSPTYPRTGHCVALPAFAKIAVAAVHILNIPKKNNDPVVGSSVETGEKETR